MGRYLLPFANQHTIFVCNVISCVIFINLDLFQTSQISRSIHQIFMQTWIIFLIVHGNKQASPHRSIHRLGQASYTLPVSRTGCRHCET